MRISCYLIWLKKKIKVHLVKGTGLEPFAVVFCVGVSTIAKGNATVLLAKRDHVPR